MSALVKRLFRTPHARIENFIAVVRAVIRQENNNRVVPRPCSMSICSSLPMFSSMLAIRRI